MTDALSLPTRPKPRRLPRTLYVFASAFIGTFLSLNALTSVILLGWLMALMRRHVLSVSGEPIRDRDQLSWVFGPKGSGFFKRWFGGLLRNIRTGLQGAAALFIATFPFAVFWLVAWWAGWENSFNKGYEQAFVGPMAGVTGIIVFAVIMVYLPMALVHQAVEQRAFAIFELRQVARIVAQTSWGYVALAFVTLFFALPIFASRGLPAFGEGIYPALADMNADQIGELKNTIEIATAFYVFVSLVVLKRWSARIYARARRQLAEPRSGAILRVGRGLRFSALFVIWVGFAALIFVGQFLNHDWHIWLTHPYVFLPWIR